MIAKALFLSVSLLSLLSQDQNVVYISTGSKAYAYHAKKSCRALKRCNEEGHVKAISLEEAQNMHRSPCKICTK